MEFCQSGNVGTLHLCIFLGGFVGFVCSYMYRRPKRGLHLHCHTYCSFFGELICPLNFLLAWAYERYAKKLDPDSRIIQNLILSLAFHQLNMAQKELQKYVEIEILFLKNATCGAHGSKF